MNVLINCEESGTVREAFAALGHNAWSCDLVESRVLGNHLQMDAREAIHFMKWDLMIAHPPCTYLSYAANHVWNKPGRAQLRDEAMQFFMEMVNAPIPKICVENPVGYPNTIYKKPDQIIHPYYFGDAQLKKTCLWLKGLQPLWYWSQDDLFGKRTATDYPQPIYKTERKDGSIKLRHWTEAGHGGKNRSVSFPGIASAMANQWG